MSLDPADVNRYGDELYSALVDRRTIPNLRDRAHGIDVTDAYRIQSRMVQRRIDAGETIVGKKVGATSAAVMTLLGLDEPDFGQLLSGMVYSDGDIIKLDSLIQTRQFNQIGTSVFDQKQQDVLVSLQTLSFQGNHEIHPLVITNDQNYSADREGRHLFLFLSFKWGSLSTRGRKFYFI